MFTILFHKENGFIRTEECRSVHLLLNKYQYYEWIENFGVPLEPCLVSVQGFRREGERCVRWRIELQFRTSVSR